MAASAAVNAIRKGCEMLSEGKAEIQKIKKAVGDAKEIAKDLSGFFGWLTGLFKPKKADQPVLPVSTAIQKSVSTKAKQEQLSYEEYETQQIHQVCEQLKTFFEARRNLVTYCRELEEASKTTATVEDSAIDRAEIELQLEYLTKQIREAMIYAPDALKDIYSRFLKMYDQILEEQEFDRQVRLKKERDAKWQQEQIHNSRVDRLLVTVAALLLTLWAWAFLTALYWQRKMPTGF
ncbi:hypothetical protein [Caudoviricetes sp.]|nr:hypothetical protein [Caudoviricetes sp.]